MSSSLSLLVVVVNIHCCHFSKSRKYINHVLVFWVNLKNKKRTFLFKFMILKIHKSTFIAFLIACSCKKISLNKTTHIVSIFIIIKHVHIKAKNTWIYYWTYHLVWEKMHIICNKTLWTVANNKRNKKSGFWKWNVLSAQ